MAGTDRKAPSDEIVDLLVKEMTEGLTAEERGLLAQASASDASPEAYRRDLQRAADAMTLAAAATDLQRLPNALRERLEREAATFFDQDSATMSATKAAAVTATTARTPSAAASQGRPAANDSARAPADRTRRGEPRRAPPGGWWAAAACLLLALFAWYRTPQSVFVPVQSAHNESRPLEPTPAPEPTPGVERTELLAHSGTVKIPLAATKDPAAGGVTGDVVWDPVTQRGYMRFVGLPHNDPSAHQYQIWIFDGGRDQRYPIDGGVFDVPADGAELIVPIHHAIPVHVAKAFAVTVEKPGGVVVSARDHVVVLAQAS
jgi:hypothetical protein